ncbi:MAG: lytic transglycosylase domain-containing protein [Oscillospiraceae bacterium]|jgi:soluble lytic murein transglycosylase|nr:lytic transglycosylase domain-containing protein [Oscillospiraceae bacterium]
MLKKLGGFLIIVLLGLIIWAVCNMEGFSKKYVYPIGYSDMVETASMETGIDKYLIYAVIRTESNFNAEAESEVGARGLMQLMEDAFDWVKFRMEDDRSVTYDDMYDPGYNIEYGSFLLKLLYEEYGDERTALAAYHSGRGSVNGWLEDKNYSSDGKTLDKIPSDTTEHYVKKVMTAYEGYTNLYNRSEK